MEQYDLDQLLEERNKGSVIEWFDSYDKVHRCVIGIQEYNDDDSWRETVVEKTYLLLDNYETVDFCNTNREDYYITKKEPLFQLYEDSME